MTFETTIPGTNAAAAGLPARAPRIAGFPTANLFGLWLMEDGVTGTSPTTITDSSGNGHAGALFSGTSSSTVTKSAEGYATGSTLGFLFDTGFSAASDFTVVGVTRNRLAGGSGSSAFPVLLTSTGSCSTGAMTGSVGTNNSASRGILLVNNDSNSADSGATAGAEVGFIASKAGASGTSWDGGTTPRKAARNTSQPKASWIAWAISVKQSTGQILFKSQGQTISVTSLSDLTAWVSGAGNVVLGVSHYQSSTTVLGDAGLAALYSYAATDTPITTGGPSQLDLLIGYAKDRMGTSAHNNAVVL